MALPERGYLAVVAAAVLWGTTGTAQALGPAAAQPVAVGTLRIIVAGALFLLISLGRRRFPLPQKRELPWVIFGACLVLTYQLLFFAGVRIVGVAVGTILQIGVAPLAAGAIGAIVLRERITPRWIVATVVGVFGIVLVTFFSGVENAELVAKSIGRRSVWGSLAAVGAGVSYAGFSLALKQLTRRMSSMEAATLVFAGAALPALPIALSFNLGWLVEASGSLMILHLGVLATAAAYLLFSTGIRTVHFGSAIAATLIEGATAALLGVLLVGERLGPLQGLGIAVVLVSVWMNGRAGRSERLLPSDVIPPTG